MYHVIPIKVPLKRKDIRQPKIRRNVIPTEVPSNRKDFRQQKNGRNVIPTEKNGRWEVRMGDER